MQIDYEGENFKNNVFKLLCTLLLRAFRKALMIWSEIGNV